MINVKQLFGDSADRCDNCRYYRQANDQGGWCMYNPPAVVSEFRDGVGGQKVIHMGVRPTTEKNGFCASHAHINRMAPQKSS